MKPGKLNRQAGFTLIELIVVITIVGIMSYVVVAAFESSNTKFQYEVMVKKISSDVRYARELALTGGKGTRVYIDQTNNLYYLKWDDGSYIQNPMGGGNFIIQLGTKEFNEAQITATAFSGGRLDFDKSGVPSNSSSPFSGVLDLVSLNNQKKITITANTGLIRIEDI